MNNRLMRNFWYVYLFTSLFVSVNIVKWVLAIVVGGYGLIDGFINAFEYFTFDGYISNLGFRSIPYAILGLSVIFLKTENKAKIGIAWGGLSGIVIFIIWGYWMAQLPFYTNEHVSSTTALAYIFIPIWAVVPGCISAIIGGIYTVYFRKK